MLIEHNRTAHRRTFELPCGKVIELWRDKEFIGISRLLGVDIQVFETRADWENFRGNGNFEYPESGIKQRTRRYWLGQELKVLREQNKKFRRDAWINFVALQEKDYRVREETGALDRTEVRLTYDERRKLYERAATALYGDPTG